MVEAVRRWYKVGKRVIPVDISVPETLRVIHKPLPSTYILMC
jgi:hypothetical protein